MDRKIIIYYLAIALIYLAYHTISSHVPQAAVPHAPQVARKGEVIVYPQPDIVCYHLDLARQPAAIAAQQVEVARYQ